VISFIVMYAYWQGARILQEVRQYVYVGRQIKYSSATNQREDELTVKFLKCSWPSRKKKRYARLH